MLKYNKNSSYIVLGVIALIILVGLTIGNFQLAKNLPGGFDFAAHWQGTKSFISEGISPYSEQAAGIIASKIAEIQPDNQLTEYRFVNPFFSLIIYAPFTLFKDMTFARAIWMTLLETLMLVTGLMSMQLVSWKRPLITSILLIVYAILVYPAFMAILSGNLIVVTLVFALLSTIAIIRKNDAVAGVCLVFALLKPDIVFLLVLFTLIWAVIHKRSSIVYWFLGSIIILFGFSMLLIPDWPIQYLRSIIQFGVENPIMVIGSEPTLARTAVSNRLTIAKNSILIVLLFIEWFLVKNSGNKRYVWLATLTLVIGLWMRNNVSLENIILVIPGLFFAIGLLVERWKLKTLAIINFILVVLFLIPWIFSSYFFPGIAASTTRIMNLIVIPIVILILLYWSRWWGIKSNGVSDGGVHIELR